MKTVIKDSVIRYYLFRGTILGAIGGILLLIAGAFLPVWDLSQWGGPIFLLGIGCITFGLLPYRRVWRLELSPCQLMIDEKTLSLFHKGKRLLSIPRDEIIHSQYYQTPHTYGIRIKLVPNQSKTIPLFNQIRLRPYCQRLPNGDLYLLYFTRNCVPNPRSSAVDEW